MTEGDGHKRRRSADAAAGGAAADALHEPIPAPCTSPHLTVHDDNTAAKTPAAAAQPLAQPITQADSAPGVQQEEEGKGMRSTAMIPSQSTAGIYGPYAEAEEDVVADADAEAAVGRPHPRLAALPAVRTVLDGILPPELCRELIFVFRASSTVGYRPRLHSATIHDVAATAPWLLPPLVRARRAVLAAVEAAFGLGLELGVEFSGLLGWGEGATLGWHHDANREYLARRHLSAVLYLNDQGSDFGAGDFRFQDGPEPLRVAPGVGRLVAYTADARNVHCVEEVGWGERCTLTIWLTLEPAAAEDARVLQTLSCNASLAAAAPPPPPSGPSPSSTAPASDAYHAAAAVSGLAAAAAAAPNKGELLPLPLGPGLPESMYLLPAAEGQPRAGAEASGGGGGGGGDGGADIRVLRLRRLGLFVASANGQEEQHGEQCERQGEQQQGEQQGADAGHTEGDARVGSGLWISVMQEEQPEATSPTATAASLEAGTALARAASPRLLRFASLQEALLVAEFAAFKQQGLVRISNVRQLEVARTELEGYVGARMAELREALPGWVALGSLLSEE